MTTYHEYNTSDPFEKFVSEAIGCDNLKEEDLKDIINPDFDNVLFCPKSSKNVKGYEIDIKRLSETYYSVSKSKVPKKIDIRFGCEFETCFILNCRSEDSEKLKEIFSWEELVYYHIKYNIVPYLSEEFLNLFRYAIILDSYHNAKGTYIDLKNGNVLGYLKEENYRALIFEPDGSIQCDVINGQVTVSCEIVTPVLQSIEELRILYEGVIPQSVTCNQSNKTMGFHVNVSAVDDKGELVKLTNGMLSELIYSWLPYERKHYKTFRGEGSTYAQKIFDYLNNSDYLAFQNKNILSVYGEELKDYDMFQTYGLGLKHIIKLINSAKMLSMTHHKNNNVVEFRIFNSNTDIKKLLSYTQDAITVFEGAIQKYCNHPENTLIQIQKQNMLYKYITSEKNFQIVVFDGYNIPVFIKENFGGEVEAVIYTPKILGFFNKKPKYLDVWCTNRIIDKSGTKQFLISFNQSSNTLFKDYYLYDVYYKAGSGYIIENPTKIDALKANEITKNKFEC